MATEKLDEFASIVDHCRCSASQEDLLVRSIFAREDEYFDGDGEKLPAVRVSGDESKDFDDSREKDSSELIAVSADCEVEENLGFADEIERFGEKLEISEPRSKKARVSGFESSSFVLCSEKMLTDDELKVEIVAPLSYFGTDSDQSSDKKLDFEEKEGFEENRSNDTNRTIEKSRKRELPRSLVGKIWGSTVEDVSRSVTNKVVKGNEKSKIDQNVLNVLRILASEARYDENVEINIFETAKRRGMTFPQSRYRLGT